MLSSLVQHCILHSTLFPHLLLRTERDSFQLPEVEAGVGLDVPRPQHCKVPVSSPVLLPDFTEVCLNGKQPPLPAAGERKKKNILQRLQYIKGDKLIIQRMKHVQPNLIVSCR